MRKAFVLLLIFSCISVCSFEVFAQGINRRPGFGLGVRAGFLDIYDSGFSGVDVEVDATPSVGVTGTYNFNRYFSIEAAVDHAFENEVELTKQGISYDFGDFSQTAVTLGFRVHIPAGRFSPYIGGGVGYFFNDFSTSATIATELPGTIADIDDDYGFFANAGAEFLLTRQAALCIDIRGVWIRTEATISVPALGAASDDVDFVGALGTLGLKYYF
jgi:outer membrane protein